MQYMHIPSPNLDTNNYNKWSQWKKGLHIIFKHYQEKIDRHVSLFMKDTWFIHFLSQINVTMDDPLFYYYRPQ